MDRRQIMIAIGAAVIIIIGIIASFSYGKHTPSKPNTNQPSLIDHINDGSEVRLTIEGSVNADELHRQTVISVSRDGRAIEFDKTYGDSPVTSATYINNQAAFEDFMTALQNAGFTKQAKGNTQPSEVGQCSLGQRYVYELVTNATIAMHTWSSTCQSQKEPFDGNAQLVVQLFQAQIPDYTKLQTVSRK